MSLVDMSEQMMISFVGGCRYRFPNRRASAKSKLLNSTRRGCWDATSIVWCAVNTCLPCVHENTAEDTSNLASKCACLISNGILCALSLTRAPRMLQLHVHRCTSCGQHAVNRDLSS